VWQRSTLIERAAPLAPVARRFWADHLGMVAALAPAFDLPTADRAFWATLHDPAGLDRYLNDPDFCGCDANILTVGTVPGR
jgi:hypothetical protein